MSPLRQLDTQLCAGKSVPSRQRDSIELAQSDGHSQATLCARNITRRLLYIKQRIFITYTYGDRDKERRGD